eukprot:gene8689-11740_t
MLRKFHEASLDEEYQPFFEFQRLWGKQSASTNRQLFGYTLRQIPHCSKAASVTLMNKYHTFGNFIHSLIHADRIDREEGTTHGYRIGPKLAAKIYEVLATYY